MAITQRENTKFFYSEFVINNKKFIKSTKTTDKKLALKIDQQYYKEALEQSLLQGDDITLRDAFVLYSNSIKENKHYYNLVQPVVNWTNDNMKTDQFLTKIDSRFLQQFVEKRSVHSAPSTVKNNLGTITRVLKFCKKLGYNVATYEQPKIKVKNTKTRTLNKLEEQKLLNAIINGSGPGVGAHTKKARQNLHDLTVLLLSTSCRWSEVAHLKWSQVDFDKKELIIWRTKTSTASILPMSDRAYEVLMSRPRDSDFVFPREDGVTPIGYDPIPFNKACKRAGIEGVTLHTLRHTGLTNYVKAGMSLAQVMVLSGHSQVSTLQRYTHLTNADVIDRARMVINDQ